MRYIRFYIVSLFIFLVVLPLTTSAMLQHVPVTYYANNSGGPSSKCDGKSNLPLAGAVDKRCAFSNLQEALFAMYYGDTLILEKGHKFSPDPTFRQPFYLPGKGVPPTNTEADRMWVRSSAVASLPGQVGAADKANMASIVATRNGGAFLLGDANGNESGKAAKWWGLRGLEITNVSSGTQPEHVNNFISLGYAGIEHTWIDKCYIHPQEDGTANFKRTASHGIAISSPATGANVYDTRITNSRISGFGGIYAFGNPELIDSLALSTNVLDTILVDNSFLSATYQPWFPGGGDPVNPKTAVVQASPVPTLTTATLSTVGSLVVGDWMTFPQSNTGPNQNGNAQILGISGNNITFTPLARFFGTPEPPAIGGTVMWGGDVGRNYTITHNTFDIDPVLAQAAFTATGSNPKGYIEMKMGLNAHVEGNIFQGWPSTIALQGSNQNGNTPWVTVSGFTFINNWIKNAGACFVIGMGNSSGDGGHRGRLGENLIIENNLCANNAATVVMIGNNLGLNPRIKHNTFATNPAHDGYTVAISEGGGAVGAKIEDNIFYYSRYGWICGGSSLTTCFPGFPNLVESKNAIINNRGPMSNADIQSIWPNSNVASANSNPVEFVGSNPNVLSDWKLKPGSPYLAGGARQASDGTDAGVGIPRLAAALAGGSEPPPPTPTPTPSPTPSPSPSPTPGSYTIGGRVLTTQGEPLVGALVLLKTTGVTTQKRYTEADGSYRFTVPAGDYAIIPVASQFWVYGPCFIPVRLNANSTDNNFTATQSNDLLPRLHHFQQCFIHNGSLPRVAVTGELR